MGLWMLVLLGCSKDVPTGQDSGLTTPEGAPHWALGEAFIGIAHRGASAEAPENTIEAVARAAELGAQVVEVDAHSTADGEVVLLHDDSVDRTTDGTGNIHDLTLADAQALDAGGWFSPDGGDTYPYADAGVVIPTLADALAAHPDMFWEIEIKQSDPPIFDDVVAVVEAAGMAERVVLASLDDDILADLRSAHPDYVTVVGQDEATRFALLTEADEADYTPPAAILHVQNFLVDDAFIARAERFDMKVHVWTINSSDGMEDLIDLGVDGLISDEVQTLVDVMSSRGLAGPE